MMNIFPANLAYQRSSVPNLCGVISRYPGIAQVEVTCRPVSMSVARRVFQGSLSSDGQLPDAPVIGLSASQDVKTGAVNLNGFS